MLPLLTGCAAMARVGGAAGGAAIGSFAGPAGAAVGAASGLYAGETVLPEENTQQPETLWGLLGKIVDQAGWLAFVFCLFWLLTWLAPSPVESFKRMLQRWRGK